MEGCSPTYPEGYQWVNNGAGKIGYKNWSLDWTFTERQDYRYNQSVKEYYVYDHIWYYFHQYINNIVGSGCDAYKLKNGYIFNSTYLKSGSLISSFMTSDLQINVIDIHSNKTILEQILGI